MTKIETNKKYEAIYNEALSKKAPAPDPDGPMMENPDGTYSPAVPIGYEPEQLEWDALHDVIETGFVKDKDYVCWSNSGYSKHPGGVLETKEGRLLQKYDPVLLLGNFGEPLGFMMFSGEVEESECNEYGGYEACPVFLHFGNDDEICQYKPKVRVRSERSKTKEKPVLTLFEDADEHDCVQYDIDINDDGDDKADDLDPRC